MEKMTGALTHMLVMPMSHVGLIKGTFHINLVMAKLPAIIIKAPSIVDVVITKEPANTIQGTLKEGLTSVVALLSVKHIVFIFIPAYGMR